ncbi:MAG: CsgG/HfaB family protein [Planctomycetota bacterium]|jgi:TolB-like protein
MTITSERPGRFRRALLVAGVVVALGACATENPSSVYLHPNADLSAFNRIAVLPLDNYTGDRFAGERVREILAVELLAQGVFEPAEIGEVNRVLKLQNLISMTTMGPEDIKKLGEALDVQALLFGSVVEYSERRTGTFRSPQVSLALRLVDVESGLVVWSVSDARTGMALSTRLFGVGEETFTEAVRKLIRELMRELLEIGGLA